MHKIELEFNSTNYQKELNRLIKIGKTMSQVQSYILEITKDEVSDFDLEILNEWVKNHYNFINVQQVMVMQNLEAKYNFVKQFLLENDSNLLTRFSLNNKGFYEPNTDALSDLKEKYTTYVNDEMMSEYKALKEVQKALDKCDKSLLKRMLNSSAENVFIDFKRFAPLQNLYKRNLV
jgi:hypothetical protein